MLSAFIAGAKQELAIYDAKVQDPSIIKLLKERAAKGVQVRIIGDMKGKDPGIEERKMPMRLHVRAIVRDGTQRVRRQPEPAERRARKPARGRVDHQQPGRGAEDHAGVRVGLGRLQQASQGQGREEKKSRQPLRPRSPRSSR